MKKTIAALTVLLLLPLGLAAEDKAEKKSGCAHGEKAAAKTADASADKPAAGHKCEGKEKAEEVILTGKLLCAHCNLHRSDKCAALFQAEGREGEIPLCSETKDVDKIKSAGDFGKATLEVKGKLCTGKDGKQELMITSFAKKA